MTTEPASYHLRRPPAISVVRLGWAALLLAAPTQVIATLGGPETATTTTVAVELTTWPRWRRAGSFVDTAHGLSAAGLAVASPRWRRVGFTDGVIALGFAFASRTHHRTG